MGRHFTESYTEIRGLDQLISQLLIQQEGKLKIRIKDERTQTQVADFLTLNGYSFQFSQVHFDAIFDIDLQTAILGETMVQKKPVIYDQVLVVSSDQLGTGDLLYSQGLLKSALMAWFERDPLPAKIVFLNRGVTLLGPDSYLLDALRRLQSQGVEVYASTICMEHYGISKPFDCVEYRTLFQLVQIMKNAKNTITL